MSTLLNGSICLTDLIAKAKEGHSAFNKGKNGKVYANITQWVNDEADTYGNVSSYQLNSSQEKRESEGKAYFGNAKLAKAKEAVEAPISDSDLDLGDDLPF